ncbi:MAG: hypothetical protein AW09_002375 [Candidatus Accumulibacter phosphatis]|uniref:Uncharacterized protein n=1 Tax=Candidatus Accumulibacter phosphatis TaxID=327160 RepID=A0A080LX92_9PROT|nr:MAG: hypothetical protein AW09_002375 [Candidatus Accumulibacter phosphatis]
MAVTVEVLNHRYTGLGQQARDQSFAAARNDHVHEFAHPDQVTDSGAVGGLDHLHGIGRQTGTGKTFLHQRGNRPVTADRLGTTAQDRGIAGLQTQGRGVGGDIRARLVDDPDHPQRHAHAADLNATRPKLQITDFADRVG